MLNLKDVRSLPDWLLKTKAGAAVVAEVEDDIARQRREAAEHLALLEGERDTIVPPLTEAIYAARQALDNAKLELANCQKRLAAAEIDAITADNWHASEIGRLKSYLASTAPDAVTSYAAELRSLYAAIRSAAIEQPDISLAGDIGNMTIGEFRRRALDDRFQQAELVKKFQALVKETIEQVKDMLGTAITPQEAQAAIDRYRTAIRKAQTKAGVVIKD